MTGFVSKHVRIHHILALALACLCSVGAWSQDQAPQNKALNDLLNRTAERMAKFVDQFSAVKCTEHVVQERLGKDGKIVRKAE